MPSFSSAPVAYAGFRATVLMSFPIVDKGAGQCPITDADAVVGAWRTFAFPFFSRPAVALDVGLALIYTIDNVASVSAFEIMANVSILAKCKGGWWGREAGGVSSWPRSRKLGEYMRGLSCWKSGRVRGRGDPSRMAGRSCSWPSGPGGGHWSGLVCWWPSVDVRGYCSGCLCGFMGGGVGWSIGWCGGSLAHMGVHRKNFEAV